MASSRIRKTTLNEAFVEFAEARPAKTFIHYHDDSYTYGDALDLAKSFAGFLKGAGLREGDKLCCVSPRVPELIIAFLGAMGVGVIPVPANYMLNVADVNAFVRRIEPAAILVHEKQLHLLDDDILTGLKGKVISIGAETRFGPSWARCISSGAKAEIGKRSLEDIAYLNYTTGSSGIPKGALATHANIYWNTLASAEAFGITGEDVHLCMFASFAHPHELFARPVHTGGSLALLEEINPKTIARTIKNKGVTLMMGLAPMYDMLMSHCSGADFLSLRVAESGGMFTRPDIIGGFRKKFGIPVLSVWGSTETSGIAFANRPDDYRQDGSMGKVIPYYDIRIINDDGHDAAPGEVGELAVNGGGVVSGYMEEDASFPTDHNGWYKTGDLVKRDAEGFTYFVERASMMIKMAGLKVYPLEVEIALSRHPGIKEVAVIGVCDRLRGDVPKAFILPKEGVNLTEDDIRDFCKASMPQYMIPRKIEIVTDLPRIGSGKINKKALIQISASVE